jgi:hypothetical protein
MDNKKESLFVVANYSPVTNEKERERERETAVCLKGDHQHMRRPKNLWKKVQSGDASLQPSHKHHRIQQTSFPSLSKIRTNVLLITKYV